MTVAGREFLLGAAVLGLGELSVGCSKPRTPRPRRGGFRGALPRKLDDTLPVIVAIHGRGGAPEHCIDGWTPFPGNASTVMPRGFDRHEESFSWCPWSTDMESAKLAAYISAAEERLWRPAARRQRSRCSAGQRTVASPETTAADGRTS